MTSVRLPSLFCPPPAYYRQLLMHRTATVCCAERFDKRRKEHHRCVIADARGRMELTVPVAKPYGATWADCRVSMHGRWNEVMWTALESAYGRTPYFEYFADDLRPLLLRPDDGFTTVTALNADFDHAIRCCLGLESTVTQTDGSFPQDIEPWQPQPYWQVRRDKLGFIPGLSILDMMFNLGRETLMYLR